MTAPKHAPPGVGDRALVVAHVEQRDGSVPMTVRMPAVRKPRLIGAMRRLVLLGRPHGVDADDRREHADGTGVHREDETERPLLGSSG